jgi:hypothetical protein
VVDSKVQRQIICDGPVQFPQTAPDGLKRCYGPEWSLDGATSAVLHFGHKNGAAMLTCLSIRVVYRHGTAGYVMQPSLDQDESGAQRGCLFELDPRWGASVRLAIPFNTATGVCDPGELSATLVGLTTGT